MSQDEPRGRASYSVLSMQLIEILSVLMSDLTRAQLALIEAHARPEVTSTACEAAKKLAAAHQTWDTLCRQLEGTERPR
jgi:hypothetical protein